jgi:hypothetical protein
MLGTRKLGLGLGLALAVAATVLSVGGGPEAATLSCDLHVSPTGSDTAAGTAAAPWRTPERARDHIRATQLNQNMTADLMVCLRGGRYARTQTFTVTNADSGSNGHKVVWAAYPGEKPIIDGGKAVTGWTQVAGQRYWVADVPTTAGFASYFRQLYVGGKRAQLATGKSFTGTSFFRDTTVANPGNPNNASRVYDGVVFPASAIKNYTNVTALRLLHRGVGFKSDYFPVTRITSDGTNTKVYLQQPYFQFRLNQGYGLAANEGFYVQNAFEELENPGEWYLNQTTRKIYYYPRAGENITTTPAYVPVVETLVNVQGSGETSKAHDVRITGITFQHSNWAWPGTNYIGGTQAEAMFGDPTKSAYTTNVPGQIRLTNTDRVEFTGNTVRHSANGGLQLRNGVHNTSVTGNLFHDLTAAGVIAGRWEDLGVSAATRTKNATISNNVVTDVGDDYWQGTGISLMNTYAVTVSHNLVFNVAYAGIHQRMADEYGLYSGVDGIGNTTFSHNEVYNVCTLKTFGMVDCASVYSFGAWPGSKVHHNYAHHVSNGSVFSADNQSYQIRWDYNVSDGGRFFCGNAVRSPSSVYASHNYATVSGVYTHFTFDVDGPPHIYPDAAWPAEAQSIINGAGLEPAYAGLRWQVPVDNLADWATVGTSSGWSSTPPAKLWDGMVETGEENATGNTAWVQYDFPADYQGLKFRLTQDGGGNYMATAWKVQRWSTGESRWVDIMPYQTLTGPGEVVYQPAADLATRKIRLFVQNANANGFAAAQEFSVGGQFKGA